MTRQANCLGSPPRFRLFQSEYRPSRLTTMPTSPRRSVTKSSSAIRLGIRQQLQRNLSSKNVANALTIFSFIFPGGSLSRGAMGARGKHSRFPPRGENFDEDLISETRRLVGSPF